MRATLVLGNSNFLGGNFVKIVRKRVGIFSSKTRFFSSPIDVKKYESVLTKIRPIKEPSIFCTPEHRKRRVRHGFCQHVPDALLSSNLCYSSFTIMTSDEWVAPLAFKSDKDSVRIHSERDFETNESGGGGAIFPYPTFVRKRTSLPL
ncbi:hypothetical protein JTE90_022602 [Oedothorax gibbosus]|uniref:Uncharacterized protein n=1 Tax=Oedothorax gibbosus TaxID=931172 RepID=A0AAV6TUM2_9ARAC|nr:hypothetical protein JTE90_022602 [Oedothorax gibbosus]